MDKFMLFANWKMNMGWSSAHSYIQTMLKKVPTEKQSQFVFLAPAFLLPLLRDMLKNSNFSYGGQNCHFEDKGAWTGENSPLVLKELGADYSLVGHSERRTLFFESPALIRKKTKALIKHKLKPIVCVGETAKDRQKGQTFEVLHTQISSFLKALPTVLNSLRGSADKVSIKALRAGQKEPSQPSIYIAYEPLWAIGTGQPAKEQDIADVCAYIQKLFKAQGLRCSILYGGSVKAQNAHILSKVPGVDGLLVGGASLNPHLFIKMC